LNQFSIFVIGVLFAGFLAYSITDVFVQELDMPMIAKGDNPRRVIKKIDH